jgi:hypothetical protein
VREGRHQHRTGDRLAQREHRAGVRTAHVVVVGRHVGQPGGHHRPVGDVDELHAQRARERNRLEHACRHIESHALDVTGQ